MLAGKLPGSSFDAFQRKNSILKIYHIFKMPEVIIIGLFFFNFFYGKNQQSSLILLVRFMESKSLRRDLTLIHDVIIFNHGYSFLKE